MQQYTQMMCAGESKLGGYCAKDSREKRCVREVTRTGGDSVSRPRRNWYLKLFNHKGDLWGITESWEGADEQRKENLSFQF